MKLTDFIINMFTPIHEKICKTILQTVLWFLPPKILNGTTRIDVVVQINNPSYIFSVFIVRFVSFSQIYLVLSQARVSFYTL